MAETKETKPVAPVEFKFNEDAVKKHLGLIEAEINKKAGQPGFNPFMWAEACVQPLVKRFMQGERSKELQDAVLKLPTEIPPLAKK